MIRWLRKLLKIEEPEEDLYLDCYRSLHGREEEDRVRVTGFRGMYLIGTSVRTGGELLLSDHNVKDPEKFRRLWKKFSVNHSFEWED